MKVLVTILLFVIILALLSEAEPANITPCYNACNDMSKPEHVKSRCRIRLNYSNFMVDLCQLENHKSHLHTYFHC